MVTKCNRLYKIKVENENFLSFQQMQNMNVQYLKKLLLCTSKRTSCCFNAKSKFGTQENELQNKESSVNFTPADVNRRNLV